MSLDTSKLKKAKKKIDDDALLEAEREYFKNQPEPKKGVIVFNMTKDEFDKYKKKYPDGQDGIEINVVDDSVSGTRKASEFRKGGLAEATAKLKAKGMQAGGEVKAEMTKKDKVVSIDTSPNSGLITTKGFGAGKRT